ncbi:PTS sugar transporter subunit IIA [Sporanaerobacter sp. PP17-6a]|uniref:PTS sugar transporter subunit IIA n=1 Tax=Sporanaerobacter sp. PP17-6a TaxID=1891289 RepID=UPI0008A04D04|nr:PTS sugar transporter subunit IIA [Sporanaerobacter sp. PP17-6a]SCL88908.1 EIIABC-Fru [Sporanaerobacter sp. PP17-6a]
MNIREIFSEKRTCFAMTAKNKNGAIDELINLLVEDGKVNDKEVFKNAVLNREKQISTGIGMGIAIPHGKSSSVNEVSLAFGKSKRGIDYDSFDGKPVHLFFLIAVPEKSDDVHLKILSQISRKLMHEDIRKGIMSADDFDALMEVLDKE